MINVFSGTHLILDETLLSAGQLNNTGCLNLQALTNILTWQKVKYDFQYHVVEISCDLVSLFTYYNDTHWDYKINLLLLIYFCYNNMYRLLCGFQALCCFKNLRNVTQSPWAWPKVIV